MNSLLPVVREGAHLEAMNNTTGNESSSRNPLPAGALLGKVALVTGGSRGIGAGIVTRLAREGASVAFTYVSGRDKADTLAAAIEQEGGRALAIQADAGDAAAIKRAVDLTVSKLGGLDILVNNAGIAKMGPIDDFSAEDFETMLAVNVKGPFYAAKEAVRHMKEGGRIINIGSVNADFIPFAGGSVYALTKAAVSGLTRGLVRELGPRGITVNDVQPGPVDTDMNPADGSFATELVKHIAVQRYGKVNEVASLVAYLAGPEAGYITGAHLKIDGGFSA